GDRPARTHPAGLSEQGPGGARPLADRRARRFDQRGGHGAAGVAHRRQGAHHRPIWRYHAVPADIHRAHRLLHRILRRRHPFDLSVAGADPLATDRPGPSGRQRRRKRTMMSSSLFIGLAALFGLAAIGVPIALSMALAGFVGFGLVVNWSAALAMVGQTAFDTTFSYNLAILPLFILMGNFITRAR